MGTIVPKKHPHSLLFKWAGDGSCKFADFEGWRVKLTVDSISWDEYIGMNDFTCSIFYRATMPQRWIKPDISYLDKGFDFSLDEALDEEDSDNAFKMMAKKNKALYEAFSLNREIDCYLSITREARWATWGKGSGSIGGANKYLGAIRREMLQVQDNDVWCYEIIDPSGVSKDSCGFLIGSKHAEESAEDALYTAIDYENKEKAKVSAIMPL